jgi:hypothetical protein
VSRRGGGRGALDARKEANRVVAVRAADPVVPPGKDKTRCDERAAGETTEEQPAGDREGHRHDDHEPHHPEAADPRHRNGADVN